MALFTKLFSSRKKSFNKFQDNVRDKLFTFSNDQVRIILFRECDFRGRKLLFDSHSIQKVPLNTNYKSTINKSNGDSNYVEVSNGYGYILTKPNNDVSQIGEIIFGSVAMSYRGTSYKLHSLETPTPRLICSQVFPSPKPNQRTRSSAPSQIHLNNSLEKTTRLEDSGLGFTQNYSDQSISDTLLVYRRQYSTPLDVPYSEIEVKNATTSSSLLSSSGYGGNSCSSISSGPQSIPADLSQGVKGTSLELSTSLTNSASADDYFSKSSPRSTKIGLGIIIDLSSGQERKLEQFLMEHASIMEWMIFRVRQGVERAYIRHQNFASLMYELSKTTSHFLVDFLTGSCLINHLWYTFLSNCDNLFSINTKLFNVKLKHLPLPQNNILRTFSDSKLLINSDNKKVSDTNEFFNLTKFLNDWDSTKCKKMDLISAENIIKDLCELLETIDAKHTNFFISTLVTAVLTHHLGWVKTSIPESFNNNENIKNPLWGQLKDLYGAIGNPIKISHTIITGTNKNDTISKILNTLTYFIRCGNIKRKSINRDDVIKENLQVDGICQENACIPKENYKKYEDHLREMVENDRKNDEIDSYNKIDYKFVNNVNDFKFNKKGDDTNKIKSKIGLTKANTCLTNLDKLTIDPEVNANIFINKDKNTEIFDRVTNLGLQAISPRILNNNLDYTNKSHNFAQLIDINEAKQQIDRIFSPRNKINDENAFNYEDDKNVVFVLGENEKLIGLKRDKINLIDQATPIKRPTTLNLNLNKTSTFFCESSDDSSPEELVVNNFRTLEDAQILELCKRNCVESSSFKDDDFLEYKGSFTIKPSTSFTSLHLKDELEANEDNPKQLMRAQSEPPEGPSLIKTKAITKYRYSGAKFNIQQYPQIVKKYMKSKNIELTNMQFAEKALHFNNTLQNEACDLNKSENYFDVEEEPLQTPSNASELEFTSDLILEKSQTHKAKENVATGVKTFDFIRNHALNTIIHEPCKRLKIVELPMPKTIEAFMENDAGYTNTLMRGLGERYISNMVMQGISTSQIDWESNLRKDLSLATKHSILEQPVDEAVAIVANIDTWEVQLMSSHTYLVDKKSHGEHVGMSQLVANMLESLLHMWRLHTPPEYCIMHIEQRLHEFCIRSKALAQLLLATEFCSMELLTSTLQLDVNDVPLLLAVASTHSPKVTQKYGVSFQ